MVPQNQVQYDRRRVFVARYLVDRDPGAAAEAAGYARTRGRELLKDEDIAKEIRIEQARIVEQAGVNAVDVLRQTAAMLFADLGEIVDPDTGIARRLHQIPEHMRRVLQGYEEDLLTGKIKVKLPDRNAAAERLFKHLGLYEADNQQQSTGLKELIEFIQGRGSRAVDMKDVEDAVPVNPWRVLTQAAQPEPAASARPGAHLI